MVKKMSLFYKRNREVLSVSFGLLGIIFGLIQYFFPITSEADLKYFLREKIEVVSVNKSIEALEIFFNGRNIKKDSLKLQIFKIRLKNVGSSPIKSNDYANIPFGLELSNGTLISVQSSMDNLYLKENVKEEIIDSSKIVLQKCIIESNQFVDLEILVLHKNKDNPTFAAIGKIAGQESVTFVNEKDDDTSIWAWLIVLMIIVAPFVALILLGNILQFVVDRLTTYFRRRAILVFYQFPMNPLNEEKRLIVNMVTEVGFKALKPIFNSLISNGGDFTEAYRRELDNRKLIENFRQIIKSKEYRIKDVTEKSVEAYQSDELFVFENIIENNFVSEKYVIKEPLLNELSVLLKEF